MISKMTLYYRKPKPPTRRQVSFRRAPRHTLNCRIVNEATFKFCVHLKPASITHRERCISTRTTCLMRRLKVRTQLLSASRSRYFGLLRSSNELFTLPHGAVALRMTHDSWPDPNACARARHVCTRRILTPVHEYSLFFMWLLTQQWVDLLRYCFDFM